MKTGTSQTLTTYELAMISTNTEFLIKRVVDTLDKICTHNNITTVTPQMMYNVLRWIGTDKQTGQMYRIMQISLDETDITKEEKEELTENARTFTAVAAANVPMVKGKDIKNIVNDMLDRYMGPEEAEPDEEQDKDKEQDEDEEQNEITCACTLCESFVAVQSMSNEDIIALDLPHSQMVKSMMT